jgi:hypothetical protein
MSTASRMSPVSLVGTLRSPERLSLHGQRFWRYCQRGRSAQHQPGSSQRRARRVALPARGSTHGDRWFNTDAFVAPPAFTFVNAPRNSVYDPGLWKTDVTIQREFAVHEDVRLEFRAEAYNVFNVTNCGTPERFVNTPQFGSVIMAATPARQIQFVGRLKFWTAVWTIVALQFSGALDPISRPASEIHDCKNSHRVGANAVQQRVWEAAQEATSDRTENYGCGFGVPAIAAQSVRLQ